MARHTTTMSYDQLIDRLLAEESPSARRGRLAAQAALLDEGFGAALKGRADQLLRADIQASLEAAELLVMAGEVAGAAPLRALGLLARANAESIGLGEYQAALASYDEAAAIYRAAGREADEARSQIGKLWALACLGRYDEAEAAAAWAGGVLEEHGQLRPLATLTMNMAAIYGRQGADAAALAMFERAGAIYERLGEEGAALLPLIDQNSAIVLRNLGLFERSIAASERALARLLEQGQTVEAARARQNLAITHFVLGRYTEALDLLDTARGTFLEDGRQRDALLVDLSIGECLLQLRRFGQVLDETRRLRAWFGERGSRFEMGQALMNEAAAYSGLRRYDEAVGSLAEARALFEGEENLVWAAAADLERAAVLLRRGEPAACAGLARTCAETFAMHGLPLREAQAHLLAARAAAAAGRPEEARQMAGEALAGAESAALPALSYQCRHLLGRLSDPGYRRAAQQSEYSDDVFGDGRALPEPLPGDPLAALAHYDAAIADLDQLRGQLMVEFRADFLDDKEAVYADAAALCLELGRPEAALAYAERARSRALIDMLSRRVDLSIRARRPDDEALVAELNELRAERDRLLRRWESREAAREEPPTEQERQQAQGAIVELEGRITAGWHRLLVHNADYAREASLWQGSPEPPRPDLPAGALLLSYFSIHGRAVAFVASRDGVRATQLGDLAQIERLSRLLALNLRATPGSSGERAAGLAANARHLLGQLYGLLVAPIEADLAGHDRLIIVPHGSLHYLPFHALHDGQGHLLERFTISYLPGASLLPHIRPAPLEAAGALVMGYSHGGRLPHALSEAAAVAAGLGAEAYLEGEASLERLRAEIGGRRVVHLATHGSFRLDSPLFSGLVLADGWLTTLESFNLRLTASLVTLSACETGRSRVGAGDELQGLMRAMLHAGAASLLLSLWTVEDQAAADLMGQLYGRLSAGAGKAEALRQAQLALIAAGGPRAHPYYWAPFFLVGETGKL